MLLYHSARNCRLNHIYRQESFFLLEERHICAMLVSLKRKVDCGRRSTDVIWQPEKQKEHGNSGYVTRNSSHGKLLHQKGKVSYHGKYRFYIVSKNDFFFLTIGKNEHLEKQHTL